MRDFELTFASVPVDLDVEALYENHTRQETHVNEEQLHWPRCLQTRITLVVFVKCIVHDRWTRDAFGWLLGSFRNDEEATGAEIETRERVCHYRIAQGNVEAERDAISVWTWQRFHRSHA